MDSLKLSHQGTSSIVQYSGELNLQSASLFRTEVEHLIAENNIEHLVIDMSRINFIDSSGIGMLVSLKIKMTNKNKSLFLLNPTEQAKSTLELVQLTNFFQIISGEDELLTLLPE